jgi:4-nitrophenyl phosphatase/NagD protein
MRALNDIRCFLIDMDGTFYLGEQLLPGALEFIEMLRARGVPFLFLTNNSSRDGERYAAKLRRLGLKIESDQIFTSGQATAIFLKQHKPGAKVYVVGTPALEQELSAHGFSLASDQPDYVVLGFDTAVTYDKLWTLCNLVRAGVPYIATHPDINCPTETGYMPDTGAFIQLVETSTGRAPDVVIGKPNAPIITAVAEKTGLPVEDLAMIGDRLYTDIALGGTGVTTILVLSGETQLEDLPGSPFKPDYILRDLAELVETMQALP